MIVEKLLKMRRYARRLLRLSLHGRGGAEAHRVRQELDPRDPDPSRFGIFRNHNCWRCNDGRDLSRCPMPDRPGNCGYPHARND